MSLAYYRKLHHVHSRWISKYAAYGRMRGFTSLNDWPYHRRGFLECWAQPGFHRFWQIWNPGIAYFTYRLYLRLGGRRYWAGPTLATFVICGVVHTVIVAPFLGRWSYSVIVAFAGFGVLTVLSRKLARVLRQNRWPTVLNLLVNIGLVAGGFEVGFRVDALL